MINYIKDLIYLRIKFLFFILYIMKNKECVISRLFFLINAIIAYKYKYYNCYYSYIFLTFTSIIHHYYFTNYTRFIDFIAILIMLYYTVDIYNEKINKITNLENCFCCLMYCLIIYLYLYGYFINKYCFDKDHTVACLHHSLMHLITVITHNIFIMI